MLTKELLEEILNKAREVMVKDTLKFEKMSSGEDFQEWSFDIIESIGKDYKIKFSQAGKLSFPDIYYDNYGIEVKFTKGGKWESLGNSILEGTKIKGVDTVYIYYGKKNPPDIRWKDYEKCLSDIVVTHNPRYLINMDMVEEENIFSRMKISYQDFSSGDTIKMLKEYYKKLLKPGEELWWLSEQREDEEKASSLTLVDIRKKNKSELRTEAMVLFPDVFSDSTEKYFHLAIFLLKEYNIVSSNLRDYFSSGGQEEIMISGKQIKVPRIYYYLFKCAKTINEYLKHADKEKIQLYWSRFGAFKIYFDENDSESSWLAILDSVASTKGLPDGIKASDIYKSCFEK